MLLINLLMQSYGSIFYQLLIAITIPNEDQNLRIFNFFFFFGGKDVTENTFGTSIFQLPDCFLLNWLPDKIWKISSADRSLQKKFLSGLPTYDSITYCYVIVHGRSISAYIVVRTLSAIACFEHCKLSVRVNL